MEIWWNAGGWRRQTLEPVRVIRQTATTITTDGPGGGRFSKRGEWANYFATLGEALAFAKEAAEKNIARANKRIQEAETFLSRASKEKAEEILNHAKECWRHWDSQKNKPIILD